MKRYPNDKDGRVLKLMQNMNTVFTKEHGIEFFLYFKDEETSNLAKERLLKMGFEVETGESNSPWLCLATKQMLPEYNELKKIRKRLKKLAARLNGDYDGWGTIIEE